MKTVFPLVISLVVGTLGLSSKAEAGSLRIGYTSYYTSGHHSCGCPVRMKKVLVGYSRCGTPVFRYYRVSNRHTCNHFRSQRHGRHHDHYRRGHDRLRSHYFGRAQSHQR